MSISGKMKGLCAALTACVAELQCRGDAEAIGAPSSLCVGAWRAGGAFPYRGNRGKRFGGSCEGML
ncbi:hypothetical protein [Salipiger abyssi]|uniref:hypothetical protein n=1 Tax=Salipiger abyssi TaxID=1250539 RepID=UPI0040587036